MKRFRVFVRRFEVVVTEATAGPAAPAASAPLRLAASAAVTAGTAGAEVTADAVPVA
ncbi:hypothetical protein ABLN64_01115 [Mycobacterium tuberculosis]